MDKADDSVIKILSPDHLRQVRNNIDEYVAIAPMGMNIGSEVSTHKVSEYK